jgi:hypothetical protein
MPPKENRDSLKIDGRSDGLGMAVSGGNNIDLACSEG